MDVLTLKWLQRTHLLYIFGFVINFRPSNPFIYEFLISYPVNTTLEETLPQAILPVFIYSATLQTIFVSLLADFLGYNVFMTISALAGIAATSLIIWNSSVFHIKLAAVFYGTIWAADISYCASVYSNAEEKDYQKLTSYVRAASLLGNVVSAFLGQLLISQNVFNYRELHFFNLASFVVALIVSTFLPPTLENVYHQKDPKSYNTLLHKLHRLFTNFKKLFPNKYVVKFFIWTALSVCGFYQISLTIQSLWSNLQHKNSVDNFYLENGSAEGILAFLSLFMVLVAGVSNFDWKYKGDLIISFISLLQASMLIFISQMDSFYLNFIFYWTYGTLYHFSLTIVSAEISKNLSKGCFGLAFGLVQLLALSLNCLFFYLVNSANFSYQIQFLLSGFYHLIIAVMFIVVGITYWFAKHTYY